MEPENTCKNCGLVNDTQLSACQFCGASLDDFANEPEQVLVLDLGAGSVAKKAISLANIIIGIIVVMVVLAIAIPNTGRSGGRRNARTKACLANMRVLTGAVEMYNMDNTEMISSFDEEVMVKLISGRYLKSRPVCPGSPPGVYSSRGDLGKDGIMACSVHGTVEDPIFAD